MNMQIFEFERSGEIRGGVIDGEPAVCAKDVAVALGYKNPSDAISTHCKGVAIHSPLQTGGGMQEARFIREADLYRLIMRANTPAAGVCEEVLPSIRASGGYGAVIPKSLPDALEAYVRVLREKEHSDARLIAAAPKIAFADKLADSDGLLTTTAIAKRLRMSAKRLNVLLFEMDVLYRKDGGWVPYAKYEHLEGKYFRFVVTPFHDPRTGGQRSRQRLKWLEEGAQWIMEHVDRWLECQLRGA